MNKVDTEMDLMDHNEVMELVIVVVFTVFFILISVKVGFALIF